MRDALGEAFRDRCLADARLADEHGVVLGAPRENLDDSPDLFVASDDGVELAFPGQLGQIAAVLLQRLVFGLGVLVGDSLVAPHLAQCVQQVFVGRCCVLEDLLVGEREQQMLGRDVFVLEAPGFALRLLEVLGHSLEQRSSDALVLPDQRQQQVLGLDGLVSGFARELSSLLQSLECLLREPFLSHVRSYPKAFRAPNRLSVS